MYINHKKHHQELIHYISVITPRVKNVYTQNCQLYALKLNSYNDYEENKELIDKAIKKAQEYFKLDNQDY